MRGYFVILDEIINKNHRLLHGLICVQIGEPRFHIVEIINATIIDE